MYILVLFAFLAGIATILAPCILPILPLVLSAGVTGGKQRPLGIVVGLVASFTFFTLALSYLTKYLGLDPTVLRTIAVVILLAFGVLLLIPKLLVAFEGMVSRLMPKTSNNSQRKDFLGGVLVGISLGLVWTPCVGPIVGSVIALAATSSINLVSVLIIVAYALGTSIPLLALIYGGQTLIKRIKSLNKIAPKLQIGFGVIMIVTALAMLFGLDQVIQSNLLSKLPSSISTGLTQQLEQSDIVQKQLQSLHGAPEPSVAPTSATVIGGALSGLPILGKAPELQGITHWLNSDPLTLAQLKGKVVLIDFWTYSCINCIRTLPHVTSWYDAYKDQGFVVLGVHSPEFAFEKNTDNVAKAIENFKIHYPVAQDNDFKTWTTYNNQYWPAEYLIDAQGNLRATHFGEGNYEKTEEHIRSLLKEAKQDLSLPIMNPTITDTTPNQNQSPETYLGTDRRANYRAGATVDELKTDQWTLTGKWVEDKQFITSAANNTLSFRFTGQNVYLVLNPPAESGQVKILLDGQPITTDYAGNDVKEGNVVVDTDRLYNLVHNTKDNDTHVLTIQFVTTGIKAFAFTFG